MRAAGGSRVRHLYFLAGDGRGGPLSSLTPPLLSGIFSLSLSCFIPRRKAPRRSGLRLFRWLNRPYQLLLSGGAALGLAGRPRPGSAGSLGHALIWIASSRAPVSRLAVGRADPVQDLPEAQPRGWARLACRDAHLRESEWCALERNVCKPFHNRAPTVPAVRSADCAFVAAVYLSRLILCQCEPCRGT